MSICTGLVISPTDPSSSTIRNLPVSPEWRSDRLMYGSDGFSALS